MEIGENGKPSVKIFIFSIILAAVIYVFMQCLLVTFFNPPPRKITNYIFQGVFFVITMGIIFPLMLPRISRRLIKKIVPQLKENEMIDYEGVASIKRGMEQVGGKLFLTNQRILFKSHKIAIQAGEVSIAYDEVQTVEKCKTNVFFDKSIRIITKNGGKHLFTVNQREVWLEKINEEINKYT